MRRIFALLICSLLFNAATAQATEAETRKSGQALTAAFYAKDLAAVWAPMSQPMRDLFKTPQGLADFHKQVGQQLGAERELLSESVIARDGVSYYQRRARFERFDGPVLLIFGFDAAGKVVNFGVTPEAKAPQAAASPYLDYQTKSVLRLPFMDEFFVFWGGRSVTENYHAALPSQRFAYDLFIVRDNATHPAAGTRNEDYYCFGAPLVAPAAGKIIEAVDGVEDNLPGKLNPAQLTGNHLIIDHGNGEFSMLAHLRKGSLTVKEGDRVSTGQQIGQCGNSGNSTEAHLHYQLQDGPVFGTAISLPAQFTAYQADGKPVARGEPTKGQRIKP